MYIFVLISPNRIVPVLSKTVLNISPFSYIVTVCVNNGRKKVPYGALLRVNFARNASLTDKYNSITRNSSSIYAVRGKLLKFCYNACRPLGFIVNRSPTAMNSQ